MRLPAWAIKLFTQLHMFLYKWLFRSMYEYVFVLKLSMRWFDVPKSILHAHFGLNRFYPCTNSNNHLVNGVPVLATYIYYYCFASIHIHSHTHITVDVFATQLRTYGIAFHHLILCVHFFLMNFWFCCCYRVV